MPYFNWNDTINLFSKLTVRRIWNATKVMASYQWSKFTGKPVQWGYPVSISLNHHKLQPALPRMPEWIEGIL